MEAIREYLNNLFMNLPETSEVLRAKAELLEMMEDKFEELIQEGKSEQEAVGIVISEFGNLEELAEELGIDVYMKKDENSEMEKDAAASKKKNTPPRKGYRWGLEEARKYVSYAWRHAGFIATGVLLCIWAPFWENVFEGAAEAGYISEIVGEAIGITFLFLMVAAAVMLFVGASGQKKRDGNIAKDIDKVNIMLDEKATKFILEKREKDENTRLKMRIAGIALCILSVLPSSISEFQNELMCEIMDSSVLFIVGIGVLLLVLSSSIGNRYEELEKAVQNAEEQENVVYTDAVFKGYQKRKISGGVICCFVLLGILLATGIGAVSVVSFLRQNSSSTSQEVNEVQNEISYDVDDLKKIQVSLDMDDLNIKTADTEKIQVQYSGKSNNEPKISWENGVLQIQEKSSGFHFALFGWGFLKHKGTVTLLVPDSLSAEGERKDVNYQIELDAGNVTMDGLGGETLDVSVDAGTVKGQNCVFYGKSNVEVDAGNVDFDSSHFVNLKAEVDCGNFAMKNLTYPISDYHVQVDVDLGDVLINGQKMGNSYQAGTKDENNACGQLNIEVDLGDVELSEASGGE